MPLEGSSGEGSSGGCGDFTLWDMTWLDHWGFVLFQSGLFCGGFFFNLLGTETQSASCYCHGRHKLGVSHHVQTKFTVISEFPIFSWWRDG